MRGMSTSCNDVAPCPLCGCMYTPGGGMASHQKACGKEIAIGVKTTDGVKWHYNEAIKRWERAQGSAERKLHAEKV